MNTLDVRLVTLAPMRVASFYGFGPSPELVAWEKLMAWSRPKGLLDGPTRARIFGFNNPNPSAGSPNYGYEFWIEVGPEETVDAEDEGGGENRRRSPAAAMQSLAARASRPSPPLGRRSCTGWRTAAISRPATSGLRSTWAPSTRRPRSGFSTSTRRLRSSELPAR